MKECDILGGQKILRPFLNIFRVSRPSTPGFTPRSTHSTRPSATFGQFKRRFDICTKSQPILCVHSQKSSFLASLIAQSLRCVHEESDRLSGLQSLLVVSQSGQYKPRDVLTNDMNGFQLYNAHLCTSLREYVFYVFFQNSKNAIFTFY